MSSPPPPPAMRALDGPLPRYGVAVLAPLVALGLTWVATPLQERSTFVLFFAAVALASWFGLGPGLVATALSALLVDVAFIPPIGTVKTASVDDVARLLAFTGVAAFMAALSERSRVARAEAEAQREEAESLAHQLQDQAMELEQQTEEANALAEELERSNQALEQSNAALAEASRHVAAERARIQNVLDGMDDSVTALDRDLKVRYLNRAAVEVLRGRGGDPQNALGRPLSDIVPDALQGALAAALREAATERRPTELERFDPALGRWRRVRVVPTEDGALAVSRDVTEERTARERLTVSEARYRALVEASSTMVWTTDAEGMVVDIPEWRALTGQTVEQVRGAGWVTALHPQDRPRAEQVWREATQQRRPYEVEFRIRLAKGGYRWYQSRGVPMLDDEGRVGEWVGTLTDVHEQRRAEGALALIAAASRLLESSLDVGDTLHSVARLAVPRLADYCVLHVVADDGAVTHVVAHTDPAGEAALRALVQRAPADPTGEYGWTAAMRTGQPQHFASVDGTGGGYARDSEHLGLLRTVGTRSAIVAPLAARVHVLGAMTLGSTDPDRRFDERDVAVAEQLAHRVALALESARLFEAERRARSAAEAANQTKSEFLATMSHELRTPLNAIIGYTALMTDEITGPVNDAQRAQLGRVQSSARHLLALIEEILTLSRLDAGRESIRLERVDLGELARETASMVEPSISMRGLGFFVDIPAGPALVHSDPVKVRQVLLNLLANAAKFTERGQVTLALRARGDRAVFEVRDTGIGIAPEHHESIFDPFWQVEQSATRRAGGTGLGLHVARRLARLLGGDVTVTSDEGVGSTFTFTVVGAAPATETLSAFGSRLSSADRRPRAESREPRTV